MEMNGAITVSAKYGRQRAGQRVEAAARAGDSPQV